MSALLEADQLDAGYGSNPVVRGINLVVNPGEVVALLGANGAGKTTTLLTLAGRIPAVGGRVLIAGKATTAPLHQRARAGVLLVPEERSVLMTLTVQENIRVGRGDPARVLDIFPELKDHLHRRAGLLSGGQQQMLTLGRALAARPKVLLADELSLGLAPQLVIRLLEAVRAAVIQDGIGALLVEQHIHTALQFSDRTYVLRRGRVALEGPSADLRGRVHEIEQAYLHVPIEDV